MSDVDRDDPNSGWRVDVFPITPARLLAGEHWLSVIGIFPPIFFGMFVSTRVQGSFAHIPISFLIILGSIAFYFAWQAALYRMWKIDPWLSKTLARFLKHPEYMPAHSTGAANFFKREFLRTRGFTRR
jgi:hypothetical protein